MSSDHSSPEDSKYPDRLIEGHEYDGIKEYDNPMPGWWLWLFYATIAWSVFYIAGLGMGWIDDYDAQLEKGKERIADKRAAAQQDAVAVDEEMLEARLGDDEALAGGEETYTTVCAACHGDDGGGGVGSAFTDDTWEHGETPMEQFEVVKDGIATEGMPAHEGQLTDEEIADVVAFINTF